MKVLVGLSGGVDSSVAALLLKQQGHEVVAATMSIWGKDGVFEKINKKAKEQPSSFSHNACLGPGEKEDIEEAKKIAKQLNIPFHVFDLAHQYEEIVLGNFKSEYLNARTPNPCVWCNALLKFDLLPALAKKNGIEFDKFATGHYARVEETENGYVLKKAKDSKKDQSYFLYRLTQNQLKNILLPLGEYTKEQIREIAQKNGLSTAEKKDSQDFYEGDYNDLIDLDEKEGNIVDANGKVLGKHKGFWNYTIGQRRGLGVSAAEPLYVIELRKDTNEVVVGVKDETMNSSLKASTLSWISGKEPSFPLNCKARIRSFSDDEPCTVTKISETKVLVTFEEPLHAITPGQSVVFYDGDTLLGGGIINFS